MARFSPIIEATLKKDRAVVVAGIIGVAVLAWAYMLYLAWDMSSAMGTMDMRSAVSPEMVAAQTRSWGAVDFSLTFVMWAVMMVAMMVPTAAPMILVFATVNRRRREQQKPFVHTSVFLAGYVVIWSAFAVGAAMAQWGLHAGSLLSPMMVSTTPFLGGGLLIAAGVFQWSKLKYVCLTQCRTPLGFIMAEWRDGTGGALTMGLRHGVYCLGCCWVLMALLFVLGVMNLLWIAALSAFVLVEKVAPAGHWVSKATGVLLVAWGFWMVVGALV
jgi:predicted metal-binding membrane protein